MSVDTRVISVRLIGASLAGIVVVVVDRAPTALLVGLIVVVAIAVDLLVERLWTSRRALVGGPGGRMSGSAISGEAWRQAPAPDPLRTAPVVTMPGIPMPETSVPEIAHLEVRDSERTIPDPPRAPEPAAATPQPPVATPQTIDSRDYIVREWRQRELQCPRCGRFDIESQQVGSASAHQCRRCHHSWSWMAGAPWPTTLHVADLRPRRQAKGDDDGRDDEIGTSR